MRFTFADLMAEVEEDMKDPELRKALDDAVLRLGDWDPTKAMPQLSDAQVKAMVDEEMSFCPHCFQAAGHDGPCVQVVA